MVGTSRNATRERVERDEGTSGIARRDRETDEENLPGSSRTSGARKFTRDVLGIPLGLMILTSLNAQGTETPRRTGSKLIPLRLTFIRRPGAISRM